MGIDNMYAMEVEWEQVERIIINELRSAKKGLKKSRKEKVNVFSQDAAENEAAIQTHIDALSLIIKFYSV